MKTLPFARKKKGYLSEQYGGEDPNQIYDFPGETLSMDNRKRIYWGGFFSEKGYMYSGAFMLPPKLRYFGDGQNHAEVIVINGRRGTGKNVLASHFVRHYAMGDKVKFPVFFYSTGDELKFRTPIREQYGENTIERYQSRWRNSNGKTVWYPTNLPNVLGLAPPYKSQRIIDECDEVFFAHPLDMTRELFLSSTMLKSDSIGTTAQPQYMHLATEIEQLIREEGASRTECERFIDTWTESHPDTWDKRSGKKVLGAINDLYRKVLRTDAPTMEEWINKRRGGKPYVYVVDFGEHEGGDRYFGEHIAGAIARANERNKRNLYPLGRYIPPVLVIDEAWDFCPNTGTRFYPNRIVEYIERERKYQAPIVLLTQKLSKLDERIIEDYQGANIKEIYQGGAWSHYFETDDDYTAIYTTKIQKAEYVNIGTDEKPVIKHRSELDVHNRIYYSKINPPHPLFTTDVKPAEIYSPT